MQIIVHGGDCLGRGIGPRFDGFPYRFAQRALLFRHGGQQIVNRLGERREPLSVRPEGSTGCVDLRPRKGLGSARQ